MKQVNCLSYAMDLEQLDLANIPSLDFHETGKDAVIKMAKTFKRDCRPLDSIDEPLSDGEWQIAFWGFILNFDPDDYELYSCVPDYHFARKCNDGIWRERMTVDGKIEEIDINQKIAEFKTYGYKPKFFAIKIYS